MFDLPPMTDMNQVPKSSGQWRSIEHLAHTPQFNAFVQQEFPAVADRLVGPERRSFLKLMAASFALAGLAGCDDQPDGRALEVPYVRDPERGGGGGALEYATLSILDGIANGILVTTRGGRPLKVEGNPQHPWSRGGTDVFAQASILDLYDPARSQSVRYHDKASSWHAFRGAFSGPIATLRARGGVGLRLLTPPIASPSMSSGISRLRAAFPAMRWHTHAPVGRATLYEGARRAFGRPLETRWRFDRARVVVALDADFLDPGPHQVGAARDWIDARHGSATSGPLLALHAAASIPNLTLSKADRPLVVTPAELLSLASELLADATGSGPRSAPPPSPPRYAAWRAAAGVALRANRGAGLVVTGSTAAPDVQEAVHRLNEALGNVGKTVAYTDPVLEEGESIADLVEAMRSGTVSTLLMLDTNPVYDAPGRIDFAGALSRVALKVHAAAYADETALRSDWHLPLLHPLESWGDARSLDGTIGLMQPTIAPLYDGRSPGEIVSMLVDDEPRDGQALLRAHYQGSLDSKDFDPRWDAMLQSGFIADTAFAPASATLTPSSGRSSDAMPAKTGSDITLVFRPDPTIWDGSRANNTWLQELPKPLTKIVWENAISIGPGLASREMLRTGDVVVVASAGSAITAPVWVLPGQADHTLGMTLGYGRSIPDLVSSDAGYNACSLRDPAQPWAVGGVSIERTGRRVVFATTQDHDTMDGHDFVRVQREDERAVGETTSWQQPTLFPVTPKSDGSAWGMVIDLDACIGCNACVVACQAENNIAVVGREQVALGREMHWLRVDRYYEGSPEAPVTHFQPIPCMHCEAAPCEVGCPVEATVHDGEGLNLMVYNRCVGTRACSGYCPYKVRRFNYLDYSAGAAPSIELQRNPQVSVRARGVMEKCTYCVQRIETARIEADRDNRPIADGVVQTACQGACPTRAITFGDLNDRASAVARARADGRNYALLGELGTRPRTSYLAARAPARTPNEPS